MANTEDGLQWNTNTNTITNTQEGAASYAMCIRWLDMASPLVARPTIPMAIPSPKLAIQQPFYA